MDTSHFPFLTIIVSVYMRFYIKVLKSAYNTVNNIIALDDTILRFLAKYVYVENKEKQMQILLKEILKTVGAEFDEKTIRASVLLPKEEYLQIWTHFRMSENSAKRTQFYIGKDKGKLVQRGVAGESFLSGTVFVGHMLQRNGLWVYDDIHYISSFEQGKPHYRSFVCVPIIGIDVETSIKIETTVACLGVLCLDSSSQTTFDDSGVQIILRLFARRIAAALSTHYQLSAILTDKKLDSLL